MATLKNPNPYVEDAALEDIGQIVERADGFYWVETVSKRQHGPFRTRRAAEQGRLTSEVASDEEDLLDADALVSASDEIGVADWIDPDTGSPAEEMHIRYGDE